MLIKTKGKVCKTAVRPVSMTEKLLYEMRGSGYLCVRWARGVTLKDKVRNEIVRSCT